MRKLYVGVRGEKREVFRSEVEPTTESHGGEYAAVIGPFRTRRAADLMARLGGRNPHVRSVADAERIAARMAKRERENLNSENSI